jgi:hypothetical protein
LPKSSCQGTGRSVPSEFTNPNFCGPKLRTLQIVQRLMAQRMEGGTAGGATIGSRYQAATLPGEDADIRDLAS